MLRPLIGGRVGNQRHMNYPYYFNTSHIGTAIVSQLAVSLTYFKMVTIRFGEVRQHNFVF